MKMYNLVNNDVTLVRDGDVYKLNTNPDIEKGLELLNNERNKAIQKLENYILLMDEILCVKFVENDPYDCDRWKFNIILNCNLKSESFIKIIDNILEKILSYCSAHGEIMSEIFEETNFSINRGN